MEPFEIILNETVRETLSGTYSDDVLALDTDAAEALRADCIRTLENLPFGYEFEHVAGVLADVESWLAQ